MLALIAAEMQTFTDKKLCIRTNRIDLDIFGIPQHKYAKEAGYAHVFFLLLLFVLRLWRLVRFFLCVKEMLVCFSLCVKEIGGVRGK